MSENLISDAAPELVLKSSDRGQIFNAVLLCIAGSLMFRQSAFLWLALFFLGLLLLFNNKRLELFADHIVLYRWAFPKCGRRDFTFGDIQNVVFRSGALTIPSWLDVNWRSGERTRIGRPGEYQLSGFKELMNQYGAAVRSK